MGPAPALSPPLAANAAPRTRLVALASGLRMESAIRGHVAEHGRATCLQRNEELHDPATRHAIRLGAFAPITPQRRSAQFFPFVRRQNSISRHFRFFLLVSITTRTP